MSLRKHGNYQGYEHKRTKIYITNIEWRGGAPTETQNQAIIHRRAIRSQRKTCHFHKNIE